MKKNLLFTSLALASVMTLSGCQQNNAPLEIKFEDSVMNCYVGEEYDFGDVLIEEPGVHYEMKAYYQNYYTNEEFEIPTRGLKFTQEEEFEVTVVITATRGNQKKVRSQHIGYSIVCDPMDDLLATNGLSGFADTGITKEITTDVQYVKEGKSALAVYFQGNNAYPWGASVLSPSNFRCLDYWTDKNWDNTILRFWAYNPTDYDIEFQLRVNDVYTGLVNIDWGQTMNIKQFAKAGEWTEILFPLHRIGVDHTLYINEEGTRNDALNVKMRWLGTPTEDPTPLYSYQLFIDGVDCVPASQYPDVDTNCYAKAETPAESYENVLFDSGWQACNAKYDRNIVRKTENPNSKSSAWATFNGCSTNNLGYNMIFDFGSAVKDGQISDYLALSHGVLKADFKFSSNITNTNIKLIANDDNWAVVTKEFPTTDLGDGWRRLEIDMSPNDEYVTLLEPIRIGFGFPGVTDSNKQTAEIHLDNFFYSQNEGTPAKPAMETVAEGLENCVLDTGWNGCNPSYDQTVVNKLGNPNTRYSRKLSFDCSSINLGYGISLSPQASGLTGTKALSCVGNTLEFDVKFSSNITNHSIRYAFVRSIPGDWDTRHITVDTEESPNADGWYHISYDLDADEALANHTELIRLCIYFPGVTDTNKSTANVWLDNIFVVPKA